MIYTQDSDVLSSVQNGYQTWSSNFLDNSFQSLQKRIEGLDTEDNIQQLMADVITSVCQLVHKITSLQVNKI